MVAGTVLKPQQSHPAENRIVFDVIVATAPTRATDIQGRFPDAEPGERGGKLTEGKGRAILNSSTSVACAIFSIREQTDQPSGSDRKAGSNRKQERVHHDSFCTEGDVAVVRISLCKHLLFIARLSERAQPVPHLVISPSSPTPLRNTAARCRQCLASHQLVVILM